MVDTEVGPEPASAPPRRRRRWLSIWVIAPVLFLLMLLIARVVYWRVSVNYSPLKLGSPGGPAIGRPLHMTYGTYGYQLSGRAGTQQELEFDVVNSGDDVVEIKQVEAADSYVQQVQWASNLTGVYGERVQTPAHPFPVNVPRHATVRFIVVVDKPDCRALGAQSLYLAGELTLRWRAMITSHVTTLDLFGGDPQFLNLCPR
jgi:hypothetical protein